MLFSGRACMPKTQPHDNTVSQSLDEHGHESPTALQALREPEC